MDIKEAEENSKLAFENLKQILNQYVAQFKRVEKENHELREALEREKEKVRVLKESKTFGDIGGKK